MESLVRVDNPEQMHLLGLLLQGFLGRQMEDPSLAARARRLRGSFGVRVGEMAVTLDFDGTGVEIKKGLTGRLRARVSGSMDEMLPLVSGKAGMGAAMVAVMEGRLSIGGNPFALVSLMPLLLPRKQPATP